MLRPLLIGLLLLTALADTARAAEPAGRSPEPAVATPSIYLDITASTWRRHQRPTAGVPLEPTIHAKLKDGGFTIVHDRNEPHDLTLRMEYRETRGRETGFNDWQTDIACTLTLLHPQHGMIGQWSVQTSPAASADSSSYVDSQYELQGHPYIFFIGELVRSSAQKQPDTGLVLTEGLSHIAREQVSSLRERRPDNWNAHGLVPADNSYVSLAVENTVSELVRLNEARAIPVLMRLAGSQDGKFRLVAVRALGALHAGESRALLENTAKKDQDIDVRKAAEEALETLAAISRNQ
jgi:hypothetical protein